MILTKCCDAVIMVIGFAAWIVGGLSATLHGQAERDEQNVGSADVNERQVQPTAGAFNQLPATTLRDENHGYVTASKEHGDYSWKDNEVHHLGGLSVENLGHLVPGIFTYDMPTFHGQDNVNKLSDIKIVNKNRESRSRSLRGKRSQSGSRSTGQIVKYTVGEIEKAELSGNIKNSWENGRIGDSRKRMYILLDDKGKHKYQVGPFRGNEKLHQDLTSQSVKLKHERNDPKRYRRSYTELFPQLNDQRKIPKTTQSNLVRIKKFMFGWNLDAQRYRTRFPNQNVHRQPVKEKIEKNKTLCYYRLHPDNNFWPGGLTDPDSTVSSHDRFIFTSIKCEDGNKYPKKNVAFRRKYRLFSYERPPFNNQHMYNIAGLVNYSAPDLSSRISSESARLRKRTSMKSLAVDTSVGLLDHHVRALRNLSVPAFSTIQPSPVRMRFKFGKRGHWKNREMYGTYSISRLELKRGQKLQRELIGWPSVAREKLGLLAGEDKSTSSRMDSDRSRLAEMMKQMQQRRPLENVSQSGKHWFKFGKRCKRSQLEYCHTRRS